MESVYPRGQEPVRIKVKRIEALARKESKGTFKRRDTAKTQPRVKCFLRAIMEVTNGDEIHKLQLQEVGTSQKPATNLQIQGRAGLVAQRIAGKAHRSSQLHWKGEGKGGEEQGKE